MTGPATRQVVRAAIGNSLCRLFEALESEPLPERLRELMSHLDDHDVALPTVEGLADQSRVGAQ
jgi:hypothetical protein